MKLFLKLFKAENVIIKVEFFVSVKFVIYQISFGQIDYFQVKNH
jgi:hypothetical protein